MTLRIDELPRRKPRKALKRPFKRTLGRKTRKATKKPKKPKKTDLKTRLGKTLDTLFSLYIRGKHRLNGQIYCYTCNLPLIQKKAQCGHYISRSVKVLRWNEDNARPQCFGCNIMHGGRPIDFRENLIAEIGEDRVKELESRRKELFRPSKEYFEIKIAEYVDKLKTLGNE